MIVEIYRVAITLYHRDTDGLWVSKEGTITSTLFYPMPDEDAVNETGFRKTVQHGSEPFERIVVPKGSFLGNAMRASLLARKGRPHLLYVPDKPEHWGTYDARNALIAARSGYGGLSLSRPGRTVPKPAPEPIAPWAAPIVASEVIRPVKAKGPVKQLSLFGEVG